MVLVPPTDNLAAQAALLVLSLAALLLRVLSLVPQHNRLTDYMQPTVRGTLTRHMDPETLCMMWIHLQLQVQQRKRRNRFALSQVQTFQQDIAGMQLWDCYRDRIALVHTLHSRQCYLLQQYP